MIATNITLGQPLDSVKDSANSPTQNFPSCLKLSKEYITDSQVNGPFVFHMDLVDSRAKLYSLFHLDAHLAAHAFAATAHVDTTFDTETSLDSQDLVWVLYADPRVLVRENYPRTLMMTQLPTRKTRKILLHGAAQNMPKPSCARPRSRLRLRFTILLKHKKIILQHTLTGMFRAE